MSGLDSTPSIRNDKKISRNSACIIFHEVFLLLGVECEPVCLYHSHRVPHNSSKRGFYYTFTQSHFVVVVVVVVVVTIEDQT